MKNWKKTAIAIDELSIFIATIANLAYFQQWNSDKNLSKIDPLTLRFLDLYATPTERPWFLIDYNGFTRQKLSIIIHYGCKIQATKSII